MRAVFEVERRQVPMLQQGAAHQTAQHPAQGKAEERAKRTLGSWAPNQRPTGPSAHEGKLIHHKRTACLKVLLEHHKPCIISVNLLNYGYLFYRRNVNG
jgi:hypothetical protein